jgi:hypothetical protein
VSKEKIPNDSDIASVLEFAQYLYQPVFGNNVYTPEMLYQNLLNLNVLPKSTNYEDMLKVLKDAKANASDIQGYSQFLENANIMYKRTLEYYVNLLSFDMYWTVEGSENWTEKDWKDKDFKSDLARAYKFFDNFKYKHEFRQVLLEMMRKEVVHTWFRQLNTNSNAPKYTLQKMPQQYYKMTGYWEGGILSDFDMQYFLQPSVDIDNFDPIFKKLFYDTFMGDNYENYNPANQLASRDGVFATYIQLSPDWGDWTFKMDMSNFEKTPFLTPYIKDALYVGDVEKLQRDKDMLSAIVVLQGEIGMLDKSKSGQTKDQTAFSPQMLGNFMNIVKLALSNNNIKPVAVPLEEVEWRQFEDKNTSMYSNALKSVGGLGASANRIIYADDKASQAELEAQITADYELIKNKVYPQFEKFMDFFLNKKMRKYKFHIHFDGCSQPFMREQKMQRMLDLTNIGMTLAPSYIASCIGIEPNEFDRLLSEGHNGGLIDKLTPLASMYTTSGNATNGKSSVGRPLKRGTRSTDSREYDDSN